MSNTRDLSHGDYAQRMRYERQKAQERDADHRFNRAQQAISTRVHDLLLLQGVVVSTLERVLQVLYMVLLEWAENNRLAAINVRRGQDGTFCFARPLRLAFGGFVFTVPPAQALTADGVLCAEPAPINISTAAEQRDAAAEAYGIQRAPDESDESLRLRTDWAADALAKERQNAQPTTLAQILGYNPQRDIQSGAALFGEMLTVFARAWGVERAADANDAALLAKLLRATPKQNPRRGRMPAQGA